MTHETPALPFDNGDPADAERARQLETARARAVVTPEIVSLLANIDTDTWNEFSRVWFDERTARFDLLRLENGNRLTPGQERLLLNATPADMKAAKDMKMLNAELVNDRADKFSGAYRLLLAYGMSGDDTTETVLARMTGEDRARFVSLIGQGM